MRWGGVVGGVAIEAGPYGGAVGRVAHAFINAQGTDPIQVVVGAAVGALGEIDPALGEPRALGWAIHLDVVGYAAIEGRTVYGVCFLETAKAGRETNGVVTL